VSNEGFVTVMRKTLYMLDKQDGRTLWTLPLQGADIIDWKIAGQFFVYSSVDYRRKERIRGAVGLTARKESWLQKEPVPNLYQPEQLVLANDGLVIFLSDGDNRGVNDAILGVDIATGDFRWKSSTDIERRTLVPSTWFIYGNRLHALVTGIKDGLSIRSFDTTNGKPVATNHIFGQDKLGNLFHPSTMRSDGNLIIGYNKTLRPPRLALVSYNLGENKLRWSKDVTLRNQNKLEYFMKILASDTHNLVAATIYPNRFVVVDAGSGSIVKDAILPGNTGWAGRNATLYSYPFLFTGVRRELDNEIAYDFIALNLETGNVDWSYRIDTESGFPTNPKAEILNFIASLDRIYLGRADARVMSFRHAGETSAPSKQ
jgi:outer membrane protein assembly factor BamB